ncbi:hypothetical protein BDB00DRAFT_820178 [Zychaea mexicana]|uniref:uncharacterized protein n=1 Tax=Zychaea mexicana TaxID=64656 RepID=UPI0022FE879E|nr:uncharacterized protein BDB00DRAFT_820178 [Zychaea mexicana]KAI9493974.1 hypothetical protein BDB00DRAFT_820178 [Zychaea mexicana]
MVNLDDNYKDAIVPVLRDLATREQIDLQEIIDELEDLIVDTYSESQSQYKSDWTNNVLLCAKSLNITLSSKKINWKTIQTRIDRKLAFKTSETSASTTTSFKKTASSSQHHRILLSDSDKKKVENMLVDLDKREYWVLEATKARAKETGEQPNSVEQKIHGFAVKCHFYHPCQSLIIDLVDKHWEDVFSKEELDEMRSTSAVDAYNFARKLDYNIVTEPLLAWLALSVMNTAKYFIDSTSETTSSLLESDKLYYLWGFVNTVFDHTEVKALGKEISSEANATARNTKRKLSAIEPITNKKMGSRTDIIYKISNIELGCLEIGGKVDATKEYKDSMIKMPPVLKDMIIAVAERKRASLRKIHVLGYNINAVLSHGHSNPHVFKACTKCILHNLNHQVTQSLCSMSTPPEALLHAYVVSKTCPSHLAAAITPQRLSRSYNLRLSASVSSMIHGSSSVKQKQAWPIL